MTQVLLDTDVVINILKKKEETLRKINTFKGCEFYICPIVIAEVYAAARPKEMAKHYNLALWTYNKKHYPMSDLVFV